MDSDSISENAARAIAELTRTGTGFRVKMHDNVWALVERLKILGAHGC
jgi:hypothetical protein